MLAARDDDQISAVLTSNQPRYRNAYRNYSTQFILKLVGQARSRGYAVNEGMIVEGSWGIGVAVLDNRGIVRGSLSIAAIESRMQNARREKLVQLLFAERDRMQPG